MDEYDLEKLATALFPQQSAVQWLIEHMDDPEFRAEMEAVDG